MLMLIHQILILNYSSEKTKYETLDLGEKKLDVLGQHLTDFHKSYIVQIDDSGEEILHEMGKREKCAVLELKGNDFIFLTKSSLRHNNVNSTFWNV